jgi:hypothetical protein
MRRAAEGFELGSISHEDEWFRLISSRDMPASEPPEAGQRDHARGARELDGSPERGGDQGTEAFADGAVLPANTGGGVLSVAPVWVSVAGTVCSAPESGLP